jgi:hypothetical protein
MNKYFVVRSYPDGEIFTDKVEAESGADAGMGVVMESHSSYLYDDYSVGFELGETQVLDFGKIAITVVEIKTKPETTDITDGSDVEEIIEQTQAAAKGA